MYSALEIIDALLLIAALDLEESDKDNFGVVDMKNGFIELDAQIELKRHSAFLADNPFLDNGIDKKPD